MKINELPKLERPREKALLYGVDKLSDVELLAILISSGTREYSAMDIAYKIFNDYRTWFNLCSINYQELRKYKGIGKINSLKVAATFEAMKRYVLSIEQNSLEKVSLEDILKRYRLTIGTSKQECLVLVLLNRKKEVLGEKLIYIGTSDSITCSLREICKVLLLGDAKYYYVIHNHPGETLSPSSEDIMFTGNLQIESEAFGIKMIDHLIITNNRYYSFQDDEVKSY